MDLESEILSDLRQLLDEHGVRARWMGVDLLVLVSRVKNEQQIDMGGFVDSPDLSLRVPKVAFSNTLPKFGERIEVDGVSTPTSPRSRSVSVLPKAHGSMRPRRSVDV